MAPTADQPPQAKDAVAPTANAVAPIPTFKPTGKPLYHSNALLTAGLTDHRADLVNA